MPRSGRAELEGRRVAWDSERRPGRCVPVARMALGVALAPGAAPRAGLLLGPPRGAAGCWGSAPAIGFRFAGWPPGGERGAGGGGAGSAVAGCRTCYPAPDSDVKDSRPLWDAKGPGISWRRRVDARPGPARPSWRSDILIYSSAVSPSRVRFDCRIRPSQTTSSSELLRLGSGERNISVARTWHASRVQTEECGVVARAAGDAAFFVERCCGTCGSRRSARGWHRVRAREAVTGGSRGQPRSDRPATLPVSRAPAGASSLAVRPGRPLTQGGRHCCAAARRWALPWHGNNAPRREPRAELGPERSCGPGALAAADR